MSQKIQIEMLIFSNGVYSIDITFSGDMFFYEYLKSITVNVSGIKLRGVFHGQISNGNVYSGVGSNLEIYSDIDVYSDINNNSIGAAKENLLTNERYIKSAQIPLNSNPVGKSKVPYRSYMRNQRSKDIMYGKNGTSTTVSENGLTDGSLPFTSKIVDRGVVTNISQ